MNKLIKFLVFLLTFNVSFANEEKIKIKINVSNDIKDLQNIKPNETINSGRIVGGKAITISEAPYQVSLQYRSIHHCGGSIISTSFILTAAHCVYSLNRQYLSVRLGTDKLGLGGEVIRVKSIRVHPFYNHNTINYDFSLLLLANDVSLESGVKEIIQLPFLNDPIDDGENVFVTGWGDTKSSESRLILRGVIVRTINQNICRQAYTSLLTSVMVCAGDLAGGLDACQLSISYTRS